MTTMPETKSASNCAIFDTINRMLDIVFRVLLWHFAAKIESKNLGVNKMFENFEVEKLGTKVL